MPVRQALRFTKEVTPGVMPGSPATGTQTLLRMITPVVDHPKPIHWEVRDAAGSARRVQTGSAQNDLRLRVQANLLASQAKLLLAAFCTPTGGLPGLSTFTVDQFEALDATAFTKVYTRWSGATPEALTLKATNSGEGVKFLADMSFVARGFNHTITVTDFPTPALTDYPSDPPMVLQEMAAGVAFGARTASFKDFDLSVKNVLDVIYDENANPTPQFYGARDVDWGLSFRLLDGLLRPDYEATTARSFSVAITDGTNTITFNMQGQNFMGSLEKERPLDKAFYEKVAGMTYLDTAAGTDLTLTVAP